MDYGKAIIEITNARRAALDRSRVVFRTLMNENAQFKTAELDFRAVELDYFKGKATKEEYELKRSNRDKVIDALGVRSQLYPPVKCKECNDTGRTEKGVCKCAKLLAMKMHSEYLEFPLHSFDEFDLSLYPKDCHDLVLKTAAELKMIATKGSDSKRKNINLIGAPGTGKTFFASCFAGECSALGKTLVFVTAFTFVNSALKYHTTFDANKQDHLAPYLDCEVLIIDDLGTESVFKNVTLEYLYLVINERQLHGLTTVITSNLSVDEIAKRYGERIASRIFDKKLCYTKEFMFGDIRKINLD